jgi:hypothetical protein
MDDNVVYITGILAAREIRDLLNISESEAMGFYVSLVTGCTLAQSLRKIGIKSAKQIDLETWPKLRAWRDKYFPDNVKFKIDTASR